MRALTIFLLLSCAEIEEATEDRVCAPPIVRITAAGPYSMRCVQKGSTVGEVYQAKVEQAYYTIPYGFDCIVNHGAIVAVSWREP